MLINDTMTYEFRACVRVCGLVGECLCAQIGPSIIMLH